MVIQPQDTRAFFRETSVMVPTLIPLDGMDGLPFITERERRQQSAVGNTRLTSVSSRHHLVLTEITSVCIGDAGFPIHKPYNGSLMRRTSAQLFLASGQRATLLSSAQKLPVCSRSYEVMLASTRCKQPCPVSVTGYKSSMRPNSGSVIFIFQPRSL